MTVLDTSGVIDFLIGGPAEADVAELLQRERTVAAPDLITYEVVAVLRRRALADRSEVERARRAVDDFGDLPIETFPMAALRWRAWELRENMTAADGFFVALAEMLGEPFATKDAPLARAAKRHSRARVIEL